MSALFRDLQTRHAVAAHREREPAIERLKTGLVESQGSEAAAGLGFRDERRACCEMSARLAVKEMRVEEKGHAEGGRA